MTRKALSRAEIYNTAVSLARYLEANNEDRAESATESKWLLEGKPWTEHIFSMLRNFCETEIPLGSGISCFHHGHPDGKGEFLWDFTALRGDTGIFIAAESEQYSHKKGDIESLKRDFEKLLYVFAPIRVLICKSRNRERSSELIADLTEYAHGCCRSFNPGAVFLIHLHFWNDSDQKQSSHSYIWQSAGDPHEVSIETMNFEPLLP